MKRTLIILFLFPAFGFSQKLTITPYGLRNASDSTLTYVVLNVDSASASTLYKKAYNYVQETFKNPDDVIKGKIENEYLRYDVYAPGVFNFHDKKRFSMNATYSVDLKFKDGKIRYELFNVLFKTDSYNIPLFWMKTGNSWNGYSRINIYKNENEIESPDDKLIIENYFNEQIQELISYLNKKSENW